MFAGPSLVVIGAACAEDVATRGLFDLVPVPASVSVVIAFQRAASRDYARLLTAGPPHLQIAWASRPLAGGGVWLAPPGAAVRVEDARLEVRTHRDVRWPLVELFASAGRHGALGMLLGELGAEGDAAARAFGDGLLLRPDLRALPGRATLRA